MSKKKKTATEAPDKPSSKGVDSALAEIQKKYGNTSITKGQVPPIEKIPTGLWSIDQATGGGFPRRRWSHIFGPKSSGKSTVCLLVSREVQQQQGGSVAYVDAEHCFDPAYAHSLGVDTEKNFYYARPHSLEESETIVQKLAPIVDLIIVDSIVAVPGAKEIRAIEKDGLEKDSMMVIPAALSKFFRLVTPVVGKGNAAIIMVNQTRTNVGGYIAFDDFSGGNALRHANSISLQLRTAPKADHPTAKINDKDVIIGQNTIVKVDKNKTGGSHPGQTVAFNIFFQEPFIRPMSDLVVNALATGVIERTGSTYSVDGEKITVGKDNILSALTENKDLRDKLEKKMKEVVS